MQARELDRSSRRFFQHEGSTSSFAVNLRVQLLMEDSTSKDRLGSAQLDGTRRGFEIVVRRCGGTRPLSDADCTARVADWSSTSFTRRERRPIEGFLVSSRWSVVFLSRPSSLATRAVEVQLPPQDAWPNLWIGRRTTCDACRRTATNPRRSSLIGPWESDPDRPYPPISHRYLSFRLDMIVRSHREQRPCGVDPPALETPRLCGSCSWDRILSHPSLKNLRGWTGSCHVVSVNPRWVVVRPGAHRRRRQGCLRHRTVSFPSTAEAGEDSSDGAWERCSFLRGTCSGDGFGG